MQHLDDENTTLFFNKSKGIKGGEMGENSPLVSPSSQVRGTFL
jgi:hypothetical protein